MRPVTAATMATLAAAVLATATPMPGRAETDEQRDKACAAPDMHGRVRGGDYCLAIRTYGADAAGPSPTLVVVLHGDMSSGGPPEYHMAIAEKVARQGVVAVGMIRPGYTGKDDRASDGSTSKSDHYTADNIDAIADAVAKLKAHHKAASAVLIGHSGGAAIGGVLIGRHPGIVERALLISCPCDIPRWRDMKGRAAWNFSLSPIDYADKVPATTRVIAITGADDDNTDPELARDYVARLAARGVAARFIAIPDAGHGLNSRMRGSAEYVDAVKDAVAGGR